MTAVDERIDWEALWAPKPTPTPVNGNGNHPYADGVATYIKLGWAAILPLPAKQKTPPPAGYTGHQAKTPTLEQHRAWWTANRDGNIALRMVDGIIGLDVDHYDNKRGGDQLAHLEATLGQLPETWTSTSRTDGTSGIRFYQTPHGLHWKGSASKDIEVVQGGHRYAVVWPSIHPDTGNQYQWIDPDGYPTTDLIPGPDWLPDLPPAWVEALTTTAGVDAKAEVTYLDVTNLLTEGEPCQAMRKMADSYLYGKSVTARHEAMRDAVLRVVRGGEQGHQGSRVAVDDMRRQFTADLTDTRSRHPTSEFQRALRGAVAICTAQRTPTDKIGCCSSRLTIIENGQIVDRETGEILTEPPTVNPDTVNLPDIFWEARPQLTHIRQYARHRGVAPDPVLYACLARISAMLPPEARLQTGVGAQIGASLNLFVAAVGEAGSDKSSSASVAKALYRPPLYLDSDNFLDGVSIGSGEGLAEGFMGMVEERTGEIDRNGNEKTKQVRKQARRNLFVVVDEGEQLTKIGERQGSTIGPTLRAAWVGKELGNLNADKDRNRHVPEGNYSLGMLVGYQPNTIQGILKDATAGTPQRFIFCSTEDSSPVQDMPEYDIVTNSETFQAKSQALTMDLRLRRLMWDHKQQRKAKLIQVSPLDAHEMLTKAKLAALLALLTDQRSHVELDDWELAETMWRTSCAVRDHYIRVAEVEEAKRQIASIDRYAERESRAETARIEARTANDPIVRVGRLIANHVHEGTVKTIGDANRTAASRDRGKVLEAIEYAVEQEWIVADENALSAGSSRPA